jgi:hypothetical protein
MPFDAQPDAPGHDHGCVHCFRTFSCHENPCVIGQYVCDACQAKLDAEAEPKPEPKAESDDDEPVKLVESATDPPAQALGGHTQEQQQFQSAGYPPADEKVPETQAPDEEEPEESEPDTDTESDEEGAGEEEPKPHHASHRVHRLHSAKKKKK